jgi:hypothetical protein
LVLVLNCDKFDIKCDKSGSKVQQGHLSPFVQPTKHERGSALQKCAVKHWPCQILDCKGCICICNKCFKHSFGSIGPTGAEIEAFKILTLNKEQRELAANRDAGLLPLPSSLSLFFVSYSFSSFKFQNDNHNLKVHLKELFENFESFINLKLNLETFENFDLDLFKNLDLDLFEKFVVFFKTSNDRCIRVNSPFKKI